MDAEGLTSRASRPSIYFGTVQQYNTLGPWVKCYVCTKPIKSAGMEMCPIPRTDDEARSETRKAGRGSRDFESTLVVCCQICHLTSAARSGVCDVLVFHPWRVGLSRKALEPDCRVHVANQRLVFAS